MAAIEDKIGTNDSTSSSLRRLILSLFSLLDDAGVLYCVLRNYDGLPEQIGNDIDLLVLPEHIDTFESCIMKVSVDTGWRLMKRPRRFGYRSYWFHSATDNKFVHIDAFSLIAWKGLRWMDERASLKARSRRKQFYIPDSTGESCILLIKDLIQGGSIKRKYSGYIKKVSSEYPKRFASAMEWGVGKDLSKTISEMAKNGEWEEIEKLRSRIRRAVFLRSLLRNPLEPIIGTANFLVGHIRSLVVNTGGGIVVAFVGPDGSGKSTVATGLMEALSGLFPNPRYYHGHLNLLPKLRFFLNMGRRLIGRAPLPPAPNGVNAVQNASPHGQLLATIYILYYSVEYLLGHIVIQRARSNGDMVVFDRYFYDYFLTDLFERVSFWYIKPLLFLLPRPDILVYLCNTPKVIHKRKPELSEGQIERQNKVCEKIVDKLSYAVTVSTIPPVTEVVEKVSGYLLEKMASRQKKSCLR